MKRLGLLALVLLSASACSGGAMPSFGPAPVGNVDAPSLLVVREVALGPSSAKVSFDSVAGAADYRIYDPSDATHVKYAVLVAAPSRKGALVPAQQVEWDGLAPGRRTTLVVEAVDRLGPFPASGVAAIDPPQPAGCGLATSAVRLPATLDPVEAQTFVAGADTGTSSSGVIVANGRGCPSDVPGVIARSQIFSVIATGSPTLPSSPGASQVFFDGFAASEASTLSRIVAADPISGSETFTLGRPPDSWSVLVDNADVVNTAAFVTNGQFDDVLFDQASSRVNAGARSPAASLALVPNATADFSGNRILHATFEVDSHLSSRRTIGLALAPATDPLVSPAWSTTPNRSASALFFGVSGSAGSQLQLDEFAGLRSGGSAVPLRLLGPGALHESYRAGPDFGLDNRERWDFFMSQTHFAVYENGVRVSEYDFPAPLPFAEARLYFTHTFEHSAAELASLKSGAPWESYWILNVPYSDERHWSNAGFEVLPAATSWGSLGTLIKTPPAVPPNFH